MRNIIIFVISFIIPFVFYRTVLFVITPPLKGFEPYVAEGNKFHHFHFGVVIIFIGLLSFLLVGVQPFSIVTAGVGWGMVADQFVVSMSLPEPEPQTRISYFASWKVTACLLAGCSLLAVVLSLLISYMSRVIQYK